MPPKGRKGKRTLNDGASQSSCESESERTKISESPCEEDDSRRMDVEEKIADFFEERPYFYDQANPDYKNKQKRNIELAELARVLDQGHTADSIWKRFLSIRTDLGKLKKQGKSGQGAKKMTQLQRWKLHRYGFLENHMKPRTQGEEFSKTAQELAGSDVEETEEGDNVGDEKDDEPLINKSTETKRSSPIERSIKRSKSSSSGVAVVLQNLLDETRKDIKAADRRVERLCEEQQTQAGDERISWGQWLVSACQTMPAENFRNFQRYTFEAAMRYLPVIPKAGATSLPPPPPIYRSHQRISQQPIQHSGQQEQRKSYLSMLQDTGPSPPLFQPCRVHTLDSAAPVTVPVITSMFGSCTASTSVPNIIAQAYRSVNNPAGVQNSPELNSFSDFCRANTTPMITTSDSISTSQMQELSSPSFEGSEFTNDEPSVNQ